MSGTENIKNHMQVKGLDLGEEESNLKNSAYTLIHYVSLFLVCLFLGNKPVCST